MAKKAAPKSSPASKSPATGLTPSVTPAGVTTEVPVAETPVRKTVAPKTAAPLPATAKKAPGPITYERIAERAYHISQSGYGGSEDDNWHRAEAELKSEV
ncbi:MAG: hypothetical protein JWM57_1498 [Phycisphaerales bacterium]|nr:hypothetical protein [Phycisphaerales bacterium]